MLQVLDKEDDDSNKEPVQTETSEDLERARKKAQNKSYRNQLLNGLSSLFLFLYCEQNAGSIVTGLHKFLFLSHLVSKLFPVSLSRSIEMSTL